MVDAVWGDSIAVGRLFCSDPVFVFKEEDTMTDQVTFPNLLYRARMVGINALGTDPLLLFSVVRLELNQVTLRRFLELNRVNRCRDSYRTADRIVASRNS